MNREQSSSLFPIVHDYLKIYLPVQRRVSPNTIRSYRKSLEEFFDYVRDTRQITLGNVDFEHLTPDAVSAFLEHLVTERGCSASTYNSRFAAIRAFLDYAADRDISLLATRNRLKKIPFRKAENTRIIDHMSMDAVTALVNRIDTDTPKGFRNRFLIMLMYDTGARVQELLGIRLCDIHSGSSPTVILHGKGGKARTVPLMEKTVQHLQKYLSEFHMDSPPDMPLFYSVIHGRKQPLTSRTIQYIVKRYGEAARKSCTEIPDGVHPHMFRHSRAMHLYQEGMDLTLISQWLGHSHIETTQIYAYADTEHKRKAIAASTPEDSPLYARLNSSRYVVTDEDTLKRLSGLR